MAKARLAHSGWDGNDEANVVGRYRNNKDKKRHGEEMVATADHATRP
jgi:hypothetical protein